MSCGNDTCRGNAKTCVVKCHARCHDSSRGKNFFHGKPRIFTRQILRGAMHVHACKSEVINERYCIYNHLMMLLVSLKQSKWSASMYVQCNACNACLLLRYVPVNSSIY